MAKVFLCFCKSILNNLNQIIKWNFTEMKNFRLNIFTFLTTLLLAGLTVCNPAPVISPTITPLPTIASTLTPPSPTAIPLDIQRMVTVNEKVRTYTLHLPKNISHQQLMPLVFVFHGYKEDGMLARFYTDFDRIADANSFIVVYPVGSGSPLSWNAGSCCGNARINSIDESAFVRSIIADVKTMANVNIKRIYATGFSNGALLTYRLACEMSDTFAAVAPSNGVLIYAPCEPQQPVSLIHVHGAEDDAMPLEGGGVGVQFPPVKESLATWAKLDGCSGEQNVKKNGVLTHIIYAGCEPGISVELYVIDGVGHSWPSLDIAPVSQIIWEFFAAHPKP
jgi:polyhydroxybutyrate depolymerase